MAVTISGTDGIVGAGFTVDNSGVSVTAGVGTFSSIRGDHHGDGGIAALPTVRAGALRTAGPFPGGRAGRWLRGGHRDDGGQCRGTDLPALPALPPL